MVVPVPTVVYCTSLPDSVMGVVSPVFRMENVTVTSFALQLAQSWTVVPRSTLLPFTFELE